jgi:nicotinate-nucleotide pyrophosphorylase (carboxylating)
MYHDVSGLRSPFWSNFKLSFGNPWKDLLEAGLREDGFVWDWTTLGVNQANLQAGKNEVKKWVQAQIVAKSEGVWAADGLISALEECSRTLKVKRRIQDGESFKAKSVLLEWKGSAREVLAFERPFLNLAAYVSGIATATQKLVKIVHKACPKNPPRISATRKTLPGYRDLAIYGVCIGGGFPHRLSLSGGVLVKENHIESAGGIARAISGVRSVAPHGLKIEVEVKSLKELKEAVQARADGVLLDNFTPAEVDEALKVLKKTANRPFVEVSGGLNENNLYSYAIEGVDVLSIGSMTHSVRAVDFSLLIG